MMIEKEGELIDCDVYDVYLSKERSTVILDTGKDVLIPIHISPEQARSIQMGLSSKDFFRPLTHDLMIKVFENHDIEIQDLVIHGVKGSAIIAELKVEKGEESFRYDIRPSDGIALVVRTKSNIFVTEEMMARLGVQAKYQKSFQKRSSLVRDQKSKVESEKRDPVRSLEVTEAEDQVILVAELYGVESKEDIELDVFMDSVILKLESVGREYEQRIDLPAEVKKSEIDDLSFQNKVLEVKLKKSR